MWNTRKKPESTFLRFPKMFARNRSDGKSAFSQLLDDEGSRNDHRLSFGDEINRSASIFDEGIGGPLVNHLPVLGIEHDFPLNSDESALKVLEIVPERVHSKKNRDEKEKNQEDHENLPPSPKERKGEKGRKTLPPSPLFVGRGTRTENIVVPTAGHILSR